MLEFQTGGTAVMGNRSYVANNDFARARLASIVSHREGVQGSLPVSISLEQFADQRRGSLVDPDQRRMARSLRVDSIAVGGVGPGQQPPSEQLGLASTSHAVGDEGAFVMPSPGLYRSASFGLAR